MNRTLRTTGIIAFVWVSNSTCWCASSLTERELRAAIGYECYDCAYHTGTLPTATHCTTASGFQGYCRDELAPFLCEDDWDCNQTQFQRNPYKWYCETLNSFPVAWAAEGFYLQSLPCPEYRDYCGCATGHCVFTGPYHMDATGMGDCGTYQDVDYEAPCPGP